MFRVLVVCTGNVCRSPAVVRLLETYAGQGAGTDGPRWLEAASAGTHATPGMPMDWRTAVALADLGIAPPQHHHARHLEDIDLTAADLLLGATREHRAAIVRVHPPALGRTFTVRELARLAEASQRVDQPAGHAVGRAGHPDHGAAAGAHDPAGPVEPRDPVEAERGWRHLVVQAARLRGMHPAERPEDDDLPDPIGADAPVHDAVIAEAASAVRTIIAAANGPYLLV